jgi:carbon monoxide dehydrogenase subunit G
MEFTNEFHVPSDIETTFATLTDLERVAPCLPGATLEEVDGDTYTGNVKVKVGPVTMTYRGEAKLVEKDAENKRGRIEAKGKESRGAGTANADVVAHLEEVDGGTKVTVVTDLNITGKPAQFGRGVMAEVGTKIINTFADRLRTMIEDDEAAATAPPSTEEADAAATEPAGAEAVVTGAAAAGDGGDGATTAVAEPAQATGPRRIEQQPGREDDALDLMEVAGAATLKRVIPLVVGAVVVGGIIWWAVGRG